MLQAPYHRKQAFDLGDVGAGLTANELALGCDCLGEIAVSDEINPLLTVSTSTLTTWPKMERPLCNGELSVFTNKTTVSDGSTPTSAQTSRLLCELGY